MCLSVYLCLSNYLTVRLSVSLSVLLSAYLSTCPSVYRSICLSVCLSVCLYACLSFFPSTYLVTFTLPYATADTAMSRRKLSPSFPGAATDNGFVPIDGCNEKRLIHHAYEITKEKGNLFILTFQLMAWLGIRNDFILRCL